MDWTSLIIGIVIGWMIALLIYGFYARQRAGDVATTMPAGDSVGVGEAHRARLQAAESRVAQLEAEVAAAESMHSEALAGANTEIDRLQAELARVADAPAELAATPVAQPNPPEPSDLKRVEGIGPKIEEILNRAGITSFQQLAESTTDHIQALLDEAGERFHLADPGTWVEQARLAAAENWDELQELQERLRAGRD
jgi:predicted flap endonuclease-1-like 5' DNA nuclease